MYPYDVALIQSPCHVAGRFDDRDAMTKQNLNEAGNGRAQRVARISLEWVPLSERK